MVIYIAQYMRVSDHFVVNLANLIEKSDGQVSE